LAYRLKYLDKVPTPTSPGLFLGKLVHRGLELFYRHRQYEVALSPGDVAMWLEDHFEELAAEESLVPESAAEAKALRQTAQTLVTAYLEQLPADEPVPLAVEAEMHAPLLDPERGVDLGIVLVGVVDLVLPGDKGPLVVDFKTAARRQPPLEVAHELQLSSYAWLVRQFFSQEESALEIRSLVKTKIPQIDTHRYPRRDSRHFGRLFAAVRAYQDGLERGHFVFRPHLGCSFCDYRDAHCRKWQG
jgi:ATP-dependent exoDNAse (exonuclease V) beta subunit